MFKKEDSEPSNDEPPNADAVAGAVLMDVSSGQEVRVGQVLAMPSPKAGPEAKPGDLDKLKNVLVAREGVKVSDDKLRQLLSQEQFVNEDPVNGCTVAEGSVPIQIIETNDGDPVPYGRGGYSVFAYEWEKGVNPQGYPSSMASVIWAASWTFDQDMTGIEDPVLRKEASAHYIRALGAPPSSR